MALRAGSGGAGQPLEGSTITCPQGHIVPTTAVTTRDGLLVCPVCDRTDAAAAVWSARAAGAGPDRPEDLDVWRRPGSPAPDRPAAPAAARIPAPAAADDPAPAAAAPLPAPATPDPAPAVVPEVISTGAEVEGARFAEPVPSPPPPVASVAPAARGTAEVLRAPLALIALSVVVTLASSCFFVAEAIDLSNAGDVGGAAHLTGTILAAAGNLVLALAVAWAVVLLGRRRRD